MSGAGTTAHSSVLEDNEYKTIFKGVSSLVGAAALQYTDGCISIARMTTDYVFFGQLDRFSSDIFFRLFALDFFVAKILNRYCGGHAGIQFARLPTVLRNGQPRYTHRLEEGITDDRHGMTIIRNEGILELLE